MDYFLHILVILLLWSTLALSQGFLTGYLGILAVHQAAAWAIGAYTAAILNRTCGTSLGLTLIPGALTAGTVMSALSLLVSRGQRDTQVVASLCVQIVVVGMLVNIPAITGGPLGMAGIGWGGPDNQRAREVASAIVSGGLLAATVATYGFLSRTILPSQWLVVRDDRAFAESLGIDAGRARLIAGFLSASFAGAAGTVFAHYATFIEPSSFGLTESVAILSIAVIGQAPRVHGVLLAAAFIILAPEVLRSIGASAGLTANLRQMLFGVMIIVAIVRLRWAKS